MGEKEIFDNIPIVIIMICRAEKLINKGRRKEALDLLLKKYGDNPDDIVLLLTIGRVYMSTGDYESALKILSGAVSNFPGNPAIHLYLGRCYIESGDMESAKKELNKAHELEKDNRIVSGYLAVIAMIEGRHNDAVALLEPFGPYPQPDLSALLIMEIEKYMNDKDEQPC